MHRRRQDGATIATGLLAPTHPPLPASGVPPRQRATNCRESTGQSLLTQSHGREAQQLSPVDPGSRPHSSQVRRTRPPPVPGARELRDGDPARRQQWAPRLLDRHHRPSTSRHRGPQSETRDGRVTRSGQWDRNTAATTARMPTCQCGLTTPFVLAQRRCRQLPMVSCWSSGEVRVQLEHRHEFPSESSAVDDAFAPSPTNCSSKRDVHTEATGVSDQFERSKLGGIKHSITSRTSVCARCGGRDRWWSRW